VQLRIELRGDWAGDSVAISADGTEIWRSDDVSTRPQVGYALWFDAELPPAARVEVTVPDRQLTETYTLDPDAGGWLGVALTGDRVEFEQRPEAPFEA
jgi:hypothetical protein